MPVRVSSNEGLGRSLKLQPDDACNDQPNVTDAGEAGWLLKKQHAHHCCTSGADTSPDCIGGAYWNDSEREAHEPNTKDGSHY